MGRLLARMAIASGMALTACGPQASEFGIQMRFTTDAGRTGAHCVLAGQAPGANVLLVEERMSRDADVPSLSLWIEARHDGGHHPYVVEVFTASSYTHAGDVSDDRKTLERREYDGLFGESGARDAFRVDGAGARTEFEIVGIPKGGACPAWP